MNQPDPPKRAIRFLEWFCPPALAEGILGDLYEAFDQDVERMGVKSARRRFTWNVIRFFRPGIILRNNYSLTFFNNNMWSNYLKIAGRNLVKRKMYTVINAVGLSIGIAFCMLIFLFIRDERSFDKFHSKSASIYRVEEKSYDTWDRDAEQPYFYSAWLQTGLRDAIIEDIPQVKYATRYSGSNNVVVQYESKVFSEPLTFADPDFFSIFDFKSLSGNRDTYLSEKHDIVLTRSIAEKIFGSDDPLDRQLTITLNGENLQVTVTGVIEDAPANSSLDYGMIVRQENRPYFERNLSNWQSFNTPTFVELYENADPDDLAPGLDGIVEKYMAESIARDKEEYNIAEDVEMLTYHLTNLEDIHLDTDISWTRSSDPQHTYVLGGLALLILVIACINYISLALTSSAGRRNEVGIRKAIGARRSQLITQFSVEAVLLALLSLIISIVLVYLFLPNFNDFTGKGIELDPTTVLVMTGTGLLVAGFIGLLSGSYPSLYLSGLNPISVLKRLSGRVKAGFTRPLVVLQFAMSGLLIICSLIMLRQMNFLTSKNLGYKQDQVVVMNTNMGYNEQSSRIIETLRQTLTQFPEIEAVSGTSTSFNQGWSRNGYTIDGEQKSAYVYAVDHEYIPTLGIELKEGRNFTALDSNMVIVNEALVRDMGWENPLDEYLNWHEDSLSQGSKVIGVVQDYHFLSLEQQIEPMLLQNKTEAYAHLTTALIRIGSDNIPAAMDIVEQNWKKIAPDKPFDYSFLDEDVARQYEQYKRWTNIMTLATGFAILISCLGLFGLAGINAVNKTKEIGIRKVMGAESWNIFVMMNKQFILLALVSFVLAAPLSWWLMRKWLESFSYSIEIGWDVFALSIVIGLVVALLTVSYHSVRATLINPAETLKYE